MSLIKQFAGQAVVYGLGSILAKVVYYLLAVVVVTHVLGPEVAQFGTYGFFYAYAAVLITLFSFRFDTALFRFGNKKENFSRAFDTALTPVIFSALLLVVLGTCFAQPIANWLRYPDSPHYVRWFAFILGFDVLNLVPFAKLRLTNQAKAFALYKIFNAFFAAFLIVFFLIILPKFQDGFLSFIPVRSAIIDWVFIANLIASSVLFLTMLPVWKGYSFRVDRALLRKMVYYILPLVLVGMANGVIQLFGVPLQERFLGGEHLENLREAGVYEFARKIAGLFVMFTTAFNYAAEPFFFNNSSEEDRTKVYGKICRLFVLVGGLIVIVMYMGIDLYKIMGPSSFWDDLQLLPILLMAYLFLGIYYNVSIWYKLSDNTWYGALLSLIGMLITLVISILFLEQIGPAASAWATLASYFIMVVVGYLLGQAKYPIPYPVRKIGVDLCIITTVLFLTYLMRQQLGPAVQYLLSTVLVVAYTWYAWQSEKEEWRVIMGRKG